jgi:anaerobic magnesium-protoporphyrin IX monomethyl ester cyclase
MEILLVNYDNDTFTCHFPQGLAAVAAVMRNEGHEVTIWDQDINHYPDYMLRSYLDSNRFDVIGISIIAGYWQYKKLISLSREINGSKNRPGTFIIGGYGPTPLPEYFLKKTGADVVVMGEGEDTTRDLLSTLSNNQPLSNVLGIAYREEAVVTINPRRPLVTVDELNNLDRVPMPAYDLFDTKVYRMLRDTGSNKSEFVMPMLSGRGCTFKCNFCYRMDTGYRARSMENILEEIDYLSREHGINYFVFTDDLLMISKPRTIEFVEGILMYQERTGHKFRWNCNGRLNFCTPEILKMMKRSGCGYINFGIEAFDNEALKKMKKGLTTDMIVRGIQQTLDVGITPGLNFIWGNIGETRETLNKAIDFLLKYDNHSELRTIKPVTPYPGSPLYYYAIEKGLLDPTNPAEDFYENKHLNSDLIACNFTDLSDKEMYQALTEANSTLVKAHFNFQTANYLKITKKLYSEMDVDFRGYRQYDTPGQEAAA